MSAQAEGGSIVFNVAIDGVSDVAKDMAKLGAAMASQGERIKKEIEATTDGFDDFRNSVDATLDTIRIFGRGSSQMADAIEDNIRDPALRAKLALEQLQKETTRTAVIKRKLADQLGLAKIKFFDFMGGAERGQMALDVFKGAALAAGAAVVGGLVASIKLGIESNAKLKSSFEGVITQGKVVAATFGQILIGGTKAKEGADKATEGLKDLEKWMKDNATGIRDTVLGLAQGVLTAVKYIGMVPLGIYTLFKGVGTAIGTFAAFVVGDGLGTLIEGFDVFLAGLADTLEQTIKFLPADAADAVFDVVTELRHGSMAAATSAAELRSMFSVKESDWLAGFQEGTDAIDSFTGALDGLDAQLEQMKGQKIDIAVDRSALGGKGGGGGKKDDVDLGSMLVQWQLPGLHGAFAKMEKMQADHTAGVESKLQATGVAWLEHAEDVAASINKTQTALEGFDPVAAKMAADFGQLGDSIDDAVKGGLQDMAGLVGETMGAFAAGTGTIKDFGDAVLDTMGTIASGVGDLFLKMGFGYAFMPGFQGVGAGLIAAGLGLKVLAGFLGGKGSGNRGGAGNRGASSSGGFSTPTPVMREEREKTNETYLQITILGDEVEGGLVRQLDSAARRGMFRNIATQR